MKQLSIAFLLILFATPIFAQSEAEEYPEIAKTLNYYLEGGTNNDFDMLAKAFHPEAPMTFMSPDGYKRVVAVDFFRKGMKPGPPQNRKTHIVTIDVSGNAATAKLHIDYATFRFIDYMTLLKIDGEWKIVSKVFHRENFEEM